MVRVAIPIFRERVAPVLDDCSRIVVIEIENGQAVVREEVFLDNFSLADRFRLIHKAGVDVIICSGITEVLHRLLASEEIELICGIIGDVDRVLAAFLKNGLDHPSFHMPGYLENQEGPGR